MTRAYQLRSGNRDVALLHASTAQEALIEYLRSCGCADGDLVRLGPDALAWRGAVYTAQPATAEARAA